VYERSLTITTARPIKIACRLLVVVGMVLLGQQSMAQSPAQPSVGKFRICQPRSDCKASPACNPPQSAGSCKKKFLFTEVDDPACLATRDALTSSYNACIANRNLWVTECEASRKQYELCVGLRGEEIDRCQDDKLEFVRLASEVRDKWLLFLPPEVGVSLALQADAYLKGTISITDWHESLAPKQFIRDELKRQGWVIIVNKPDNLIIFESHSPKRSDLCTWNRVISTAKIAQGLGSDGYCQVLQFQPEFMKMAVQREANRRNTALQLRCPPWGSGGLGKRTR
jgi:hypothetical protein